jgi:hypothetical protein
VIALELAVELRDEHGVHLEHALPGRELAVGEQIGGR